MIIRVKSANETSFPCKKFNKNIRAYVDNELSGSVKADFIAHTSQCGDCDTSLNEMEGVVKLLANLQPVSVSESFDYAMKTRILIEQERLGNPLYRFSLYVREKSRYFLTVPAFALAVTAVLFFFSGTYDSMFRGNTQRAATSAEDVLNGVDLLAGEEGNPDEIVYVYHVLDTVMSQDGGIDYVPENNETDTRIKTVASSFNTVSF